MGCPVPHAKIYRFSFRKIRIISNAVSRPPEGRIAIATTRGARDAMDAAFSTANGSAAYGEVVWSWRRDAGAKSAGGIPPVTVTTSPLHRGEHEVSRKAIARGMSECFRSPVCSCAPTAQFLAHETAGAACTRHSLRPRFSRGSSKPRAIHAARSRTYVLRAAADFACANPPCRAGFFRGDAARAGSRRMT